MLELGPVLLFRVSTSSIIVDPGADKFVIEAARPAADPGPLSPVYINRQHEDVCGNVILALYINFVTPGIMDVVLRHCDVSPGHNIVTSTPVSGD